MTSLSHDEHVLLFYFHSTNPSTVQNPETATRRQTGNPHTEEKFYFSFQFNTTMSDFHILLLHSSRSIFIFPNSLTSETPAAMAPTAGKNIQRTFFPHSFLFQLATLCRAVYEAKQSQC